MLQNDVIVTNLMSLRLQSVGLGTDDRGTDGHPPTAVAPMTGGQRGIIRGGHAGRQRRSAPLLFEPAVNAAGPNLPTE